MATKSGKTIAARSAPNYMGVDLSAPAPVQYGGSGSSLSTSGAGGISIADAIAQAQQGQNAANLANNQRYTQGLGVLTGSASTAANQLAGGSTQAQDYISQAIANSNQYGNTARTQLGQQLQDNQGQSAQSAVSRGLTNTTIADSMKALNQRTYNRGAEQINEDVANRMSGLNLNQAQTATQFAQAKASQTSQSGNSIAGFIAARNDNAPSIGEYASLVQGAADQPAASVKGTVVNAPASYTGSGANTPTFSPKSGTSGGSSSGSNYFNAATASGGSGSGSGGFQGGTGGSVSGGGASTAPDSSSGSPIANSTSSASGGKSFMNDAGNTKITDVTPPSAGGSAPSGAERTESAGTASITPSPGSNAPMDIYSYYGVPFASILSDKQFRDYATYVNSKKGK
jgi:hypothetical protein